ncbi:MAG: M12 family metallo-peptidase, partial [Planctomycetota bacterium]|nr:M12 family metallo-peptidase [Planctomycetota bacterium]
MRLALHVPAFVLTLTAVLATGAYGFEELAASDRRRARVDSESVVPAGAYFTKTHDSSDSHVTVAWDRQAIRSAVRGRKRLLITRFPLGADHDVNLEIEPFAVTGPSTRFVLGRKGAPDVPLDFDASRIDLYVGRVSGKPGSHVFFALSDNHATGYVDLGSGAARHQISSMGRDGLPTGPGRFTVFEATGGAAYAPAAPMCGLVSLNGEGSHGVPIAGPPRPRSVDPVLGQRMIRLAVETDYEFFSLFGDVDAAATYLVEMYGQVSAIFARDVNVRVELVFVRIWDDPDDLFNDVDPSPLNEFRTYWNDNMDFVERGAAQLLSGRRDYPFGGQAYLSQLCTSSAYSVVGYAMGFFPDPTQPSPYTYDITVTAHELAHNFGTGHTHASPNFIDTCQDPQTTPQRGTIMSYCGQTWSGGNANRDSRFHTTIVQNMASYIESRSDSVCAIRDCNSNGVYDGVDILFGGAADLNGNGVPDVCEDCNDNQILDDQDISGGGSQDLNANGIPDECEPDCNNNNIPDDKDIADGSSTDLYGDGIPDECEAD